MEKNDADPQFIDDGGAFLRDGTSGRRAFRCAIPEAASSAGNHLGTFLPHASQRTDRYGERLAPGEISPSFSVDGRQWRDGERGVPILRQPGVHSAFHPKRIFAPEFQSTPRRKYVRSSASGSGRQKDPFGDRHTFRHKPCCGKVSPLRKDVFSMPLYCS